MQTTIKNLGTAALTAALLVGTFLVSNPAKADVAAAEATFKAKCAGCHGADGKGKPAMKTRDWSSEDIQKMSDAELGAIITNGKSPMPAYKTMTADQVKDMVAYVRTFKK
jgi:mono/diheme cytochrome c family protein